MMTKRKTVTVFCASSEEATGVYYTEAEKFGRMLAENNYEIIYGGGKSGLMGSLANGALAAGGRVIGVIPKFMKELNLGHETVTHLIVADDIKKRQSLMMRNTDIIVALPGGCGTLYELIEAITLKFLGLLPLPILIINVNGYFNKFVDTLEHAVYEKFMKNGSSNLWKVLPDADSAMEEIRLVNHTFEPILMPVLN
ncbi:MAG: hypothetical protein HW421_298 [Ignavibacteria bacterium]|nr:hypothetical protein [Ignavibacteria bacterium]